MHAIWCVRPNDNGEPDFPAGIPLVTVVPADLRVSDVVEGHRHTVMGCLALGSNHYHYVFFGGDDTAIVQEFYGAGTEHEHDFPADATRFLVFVLCSDAAYAQLLTELPNLVILGHCEITIEEGVAIIGKVDNTPWDGPTRTDWETKFDAFGVALPAAVTNDRRLVMFCLAAFHEIRQGVKSDQALRYASYDAL